MTESTVSVTGFKKIIIRSLNSNMIPQNWNTRVMCDCGRVYIAFGFKYQICKSKIFDNFECEPVECIKHRGHHFGRGLPISSQWHSHTFIAGKNKKRTSTRALILHGARGDKWAIMGYKSTLVRHPLRARGPAEWRNWNGSASHKGAFLLTDIPFW